MEGNGPEIFWDDLEVGVYRKVERDFVLVKPFAAPAVWIKKGGRGKVRRVEMIKETAVD